MCYKHFKSADFSTYKVRQGRRLKHCRVPSLHLPQKCAVSSKELFKVASNMLNVPLPDIGPDSPESYQNESFCNKDSIEESIKATDAICHENEKSKRSASKKKPNILSEKQEILLQKMVIFNDSICPICQASTYVGKTIICEKCEHWFHFECVGVTSDDLCVQKQDVPYFCSNCGGKPTKTNEKANEKKKFESPDGKKNFKFLSKKRDILLQEIDSNSKIGQNKSETDIQPYQNEQICNKTRIFSKKSGKDVFTQIFLPRIFSKKSVKDIFKKKYFSQ